MNKRRIFAGLATVIIIVIAVFVVNYLGSLQKVTINYTNSSNITITSTKRSMAGEGTVSQTTTIAKISHSGESISIKKGVYTVLYKGENGYSDGSVDINLGNTPKTLGLDPTYSDSKLNSLLDGEFGEIKNVLSKKYTNLDLYLVQRGKLYDKGQWYGTTLKYIGSDVFNSDTLRVVLHKENGLWKIITDPPNITISKLLYPDIPKDILSDLNNIQ